MPPIVVLTGGGIKGAVIATRAAQEHKPVLVHADYGQPAAQQEQVAVRALAESLPAASAVTLDLPSADELQQPHRPSSESSEAGRASEAYHLASRGLMPLLLSLGVQCALRIGASTVVLGLSRMIDATHVGLPNTDDRVDRKREFLHAYRMMLDTVLSRSAAVSVAVPLMDLTYPEVMKLAFRFHVPLQKTRTCVRPTGKACGQCEPCTARARAMAEADMIDPLVNAPTMKHAPVEQRQG